MVNSDAENRFAACLSQDTLQCTRGDVVIAIPGTPASLSTLLALAIGLVAQTVELSPVFDEPLLRLCLR